MIRVFIVEDSVTTRRYLQTVFQAAGDFEVVGIAGTAQTAVEAIPRIKPDLVTLDVFLPDQSAADIVRQLLAQCTPAIVLLSEAPRDSTEVFDALSAGALDFMRKPRPGEERSIATLLNALRALSRSGVAPKRAAGGFRRPLDQLFSVVTIAASTGGPSALNLLFSQIPQTFPLPIVIAQHMAEGFEEGMCRWLSQVSPLTFEVAGQTAKLRPGHVVLGRAYTDIFFRSKTEVASRKAPPLGYHPSGDVLLESAARVFGSEAVAVVMSGIGSDGTLGATKIKDAGGFIMSQSAATSVVYGMPRSVEEANLSSYVGTPQELAQCLVRCANARIQGTSK